VVNNHARNCYLKRSKKHERRTEAKGMQEETEEKRRDRIEQGYRAEKFTTALAVACELTKYSTVEDAEEICALAIGFIKMRGRPE
jgi:hypothetical protein